MPPKTDDMKEQAQLLRELVAFSNKKFPTDEDLKFRAAVMKRIYTQLEHYDRPQLVRMVEATCDIDYPTATDRNFHDQVMARLGRLHSLADMRKVEIPGKWSDANCRRPAPSAVAGRKAA